MIKYKLETAKKIFREKGIFKFLWESFLFIFYRPLMNLMNLISSITILLKKKKYFYFKEKKLSYFYHRYNSTWKNERIIEIPIVVDYIKKFPNKKILEFGAVLKHYYPIKWDILDKYERGKNIINQDVIDFKPKQKYDLIVSISTLEHVGFDEEKKDSLKILKAIENLRKNCLNKEGKAIFTMPLGYNIQMDKLLFERKIKFDEKVFLKRINKKNEWKEASEEESKKARYGSPFKAANYLIVGIIKK